MIYLFHFSEQFEERKIVVKRNMYAKIGIRVDQVCRAMARQIQEMLLEGVLKI